MIAFGRVKNPLEILDPPLNRKLPSKSVAFPLKRRRIWPPQWGRIHRWRSRRQRNGDISILDAFVKGPRKPRGTGLHSQRLEKTRWTTRGEIGRRAESKEIDFGETLNWAYLHSHLLFRAFHLNCFQRTTRLRYNGWVRLNGGVRLNGRACLMAGWVRPSGRLMR